jgi:hypothetical protein
MPRDWWPNPQKRRVRLCCLALWSPGWGCGLLDESNDMLDKTQDEPDQGRGNY